MGTEVLGTRDSLEVEGDGESLEEVSHRSLDGEAASLLLSQPYVWHPLLHRHPQRQPLPGPVNGTWFMYGTVYSNGRHGRSALEDRDGGEEL